ncbi:nucleoside phosphorylase domain-containing protein [Halenospora varia]|nr:nucleoside phosphorylase domain-containing protein [Halenospora varia]
MKVWNEAVEGLKAVIGDNFVPEIGIIAGTGLSVLESTFEEPKHVISYSSIKGFPVSAVSGHASKLVFGTISASKTPAMLMSGRAHYYEGHSLQDVTLPVRVMKLLGVKTLIITNAAGALNQTYSVGDIVILNDHINFPGLAGLSPLRGANLGDFGPRFPALSDAYDLGLRRIAHSAAKQGLKMSLDCEHSGKIHEGVYAFVGGPHFETRAECRMLAKLGADLVGMSTVPEVIVARHCGIRVLAVSIISNMALLESSPHGDVPSTSGYSEQEGKVDHEDVLDATKGVSVQAKDMIVKIVEMLEHQDKNFTDPE